MWRDCFSRGCAALVLIRYEAGVHGRGAIEADEYATVVDAVDDGRAHSARIIDGHKAILRGPDEPVRVVTGVHVLAHDLAFVVEAQRLGEDATRGIEGRKLAGVEQEAVVYGVDVDVEAADLLAVVDAGGLRSAGRSRNDDHQKNTAILVVDIRNVGR